jgi:nucleoside-diphosphate-sugar epimerase
MPAVPAPAKVLVSGVNGYVGIWVARRYLEHGYSVRGTVRSIERAGKHLRETFASYGNKFELVEVVDITAVRVCAVSRLLTAITWATGWCIR